MKPTYCDHFEQTKQRFEGWWNREDIGAPLMRIEAPRGSGPVPPYPAPKTVKDLYLNPGYIVDRYRYYCDTHCFLGDAYPNISADLGPGSIALYLGGQPRFAEDTVWFEPCIEDAEEFPKLAYREDNPWWVLHRKLLEEVKALAGGDFVVNIPDLIENVDILSALRDPQTFCYDLYDSCDEVREGIHRVDEVYFRYYDRFWKMLREEDGTSGFTAFNIIGKGRTAKLQCDFSALISPDMYRDLVKPSLERQCESLDHALYHLDGPDAVKHLDTVMEIDGIQALQWTCGAGQPDGGCPQWYPIYDKVREAGKSVWAHICDGTVSDWYDKTKAMIDRYGRAGMYFLYPCFPDEKTAREFLDAFRHYR